MARTPDGDEPFLAMAVIEDIDDRYKARMALEQAKQDLERVVEERTAALRPWLEHYNYTRPHGSRSHKPPGSRLTKAPRNYN